jgi:hypothetical protein
VILTSIGSEYAALRMRRCSTILRYSAFLRRSLRLSDILVTRARGGGGGWWPRSGTCRPFGFDIMLFSLKAPPVPCRL